MPKSHKFLFAGLDYLPSPPITHLRCYFFLNVNKHDVTWGTG